MPHVRPTHSVIRALTSERNVRAAILVAILVLAALVAGGCCAVPATYLAADRATYDAIAPEYLAHVEASTTLDAAAKARRKRTVEAWRRRIEEAGKAEAGR